MGYQLVTPPTVEPLTLAEAKAHLRVDIADEDALINSIITATRQYCEQITGRSLLAQQWRLVLDQFPPVIELEKGPITAITSVIYTDMSGAVQTAAESDYVADLSGSLTRLTPKFGAIWPIALPQIGSVAVNFTAGYGAAAASVPVGLKNWMLLRIAALYNSREELVVLHRGESVAPHPFIDSLLDAYRIWRV